MCFLLCGCGYVPVWNRCFTNDWLWRCATWTDTDSLALLPRVSGQIVQFACSNDPIWNVQIDISLLRLLLAESLCGRLDTQRSHGLDSRKIQTVLWKCSVLTSKQAVLRRHSSSQFCDFQTVGSGDTETVGSGEAFILLVLVRYKQRVFSFFRLVLKTFRHSVPGKQTNIRLWRSANMHLWRNVEICCAHRHGRHSKGLFCRHVEEMVWPRITECALDTRTKIDDLMNHRTKRSRTFTL